jgi:hypothetical protein
VTEQEAAELYNHVLVRLRELKATELVREIEVTVGRGELRSEVGAKSDALQTPLSPHEALVVTLRMFVAAVEPPILRAETEKALKTTIAWRFDELEPRHLQHGAGTKPFPEPGAASREAPDFPSLTKVELETLCNHATQLLNLALDAEKEVDGANARGSSHGG